METLLKEQIIELVKELIKEENGKNTQIDNSWFRDLTERSIRNEENIKSLIKEMRQSREDNNAKFVEAKEEMNTRFAEVRKDLQQSREDNNARFAEVKKDSDTRFTEVKKDSDARFAEVRKDLQQSREDNNAKFAEVKKDSDARFAEVKKDSDARFAEVREDTNRRFLFMQWSLGIGFSSLIVLITIFKFLF